MRNEVKKQGWPGTVPGATPNKGVQATAYRCDVKVARQEWS